MNRIISSVNDKFLPISIFMDLSEAFDIFIHAILLEQLRYYGINVASLDCFRSYLANGKQYVEIDNEKFSCQTLRLEYHKSLFFAPPILDIHEQHSECQSGIAFTFILYDTNLFSIIEYSTQFVHQKQTNC